MKMPNTGAYYIIHLQYLGFRFHGWMKQPGVKTVELMVEKTVTHVLGHGDFKILGSSRTDAMVSANHSAFELFIREPLDVDGFLREFNLNLPNDIRAIKIEETHKDFNIIKGPRIKEYIYLFSFGEKCHPFSAPFIASFSYDLDIEVMKKGAALFLGKHNFIRYCTKPGPGTQFEREILVSEISENKMFKANFFPKTSYALTLCSKGFLRHQVRLIMGQLLELGQGKIRLSDIAQSLTGQDHHPLRSIAPPSGLILNKIEFMTSQIGVKE